MMREKNIKNCIKLHKNHQKLHKNAKNCQITKKNAKKIAIFLKISGGTGWEPCLYSAVIRICCLSLEPPRLEDKSQVRLCPLGWLEDIKGGRESKFEGLAESRSFI